ncbi:unnamed protein product [Sphagnum jensenii]|uniref:Uncharacterized protein n=1 Tax=Sphagnum jensenii TaxID=128206 RepID=A0ABP0WLQ0_9BRYO
MNPSSIRDSFDRVTKKQKIWHVRTQENADKLLEAVSETITELMTISDSATDFDSKTVIAALQASASTVIPNFTLRSPAKETNVAMNRCGKLVDKFFNPDIAKAYRDIDFDSHLVNQIVALHFYRQGLFSLGDYFIAEANESEALSLKGPFFEMYQILEQIGVGNLGPALAWTKLHQEALDYKKSSLQFNLQRLQLVQFLQRGDRSAALEYVRSSFRQFINNHMRDIQRLMGCLLWAGRLEISPYSDLLAREHWDAIAVEFTHECCGMMGQASNSPLFITICAGSQALPMLLKLASVMVNKKHEWHAMRQLPVEIELNKAFQFHSVFACPVSRDQSTAENPPMLLPCGHVLCKHSIHKLVKGNNRTFKCPYCPSETTVAFCRQIHF